MPDIHYQGLDHQKKVLKSDKKMIFMGGGVGCGKTDTGSLWSLGKVSQTPDGVKGIICANSYSQLIDSTLANLYKNYDEWKIWLKPNHPPKAHRPFSIKVWTGQHWVEVLCRSLDNFEMLSGIETGWWWADEVFQTKKEAIDLLNARLRDKRMPKLQALMTTTLDDPSTWMYEMFVENRDPNLIEAVYATTYDNEKNLPEGYIDGLKSTYSKAMFDRMVLCKWVALEGMAIYHAFERSSHVREDVEYEPLRPILWSHDFNIGQGKPASSCLCQIHKGKGKDGETRLELHVFDEIILETSDTNDVIVEFKNRYPKAKDVVIYGDASGRAKDTRSKTTDYVLLSDAGFDNQKVPRANPPIRDRHNSVNRLLKDASDDVRVLIHPRCKTLIKGLEVVKLKKGASYIEEEIYSQHVTTALGYLIHKEFPIVKPRPKSGNIILSRTGM